MHTVSSVKDRHEVEFFLLGVYTSRVHVRSMARSVSQKKKVLKAMFTLSDRIAFLTAQKPYRMGLLLTHKNGDFGAISVTE